MLVVYSLDANVVAEARDWLLASYPNKVSSWLIGAAGWHQNAWCRDFQIYDDNMAVMFNIMWSEYIIR